MDRNAEGDGDPKYHLPRGTPPVNAHRLAKNDLHSVENPYGDRGGTLIKAKYDLDRLLENQTINAFQLRAAKSMKTLYSVAFGFLGYGAMGNILSGNYDIGEFDIPPLDRYVRVMRALTMVQRNIVHRTCTRELMPNDFDWLHHCRSTVQSTFERVGATLELLEEQSKEKAVDSDDRFR